MENGKIPINQGNGDQPQDMENLLLDSLKFQLKRGVIVLYKRLLYIMDDVAFNHDKMMNKIAEDMTTEQLAKLAAADSLTEADFENIRKKILDTGNDTIRELEAAIENHRKFNI